MPGQPSLRDAHVHLEATLRLTSSPEPDAGGAATFERVLSGCARDLAAGGAGEALVRFNPLSWQRRGAAIEDQLGALPRAASAARDHGLSLRPYVTLKREAGEAELQEAVDFALAARECGVEGVDVSRSYDVADPEARPGGTADARALASAVARARDGGLVVAMHCGWYDGVPELADALELGATRIGHAVPLAREPGLLPELAERGVTIEVCPTSFERRSGEDLSWLPLERWLDAGLEIEVGTDHPLALRTDPEREHRRLRTVLPAWTGAGVPTA